MTSTPVCCRRALDRVERQAQHIAVLEEKLAAANSRLGRRGLIVAPSAPPPPRGPYAPVPRHDTRAADLPWWPTAGRPRRTLRPQPGWMRMSLGATGVPHVGFSVCGFDRQRLADMIRLVGERQMKDADFIPVFLTDSTEFDLFHGRGYSFEYFPAPEIWPQCEGSIRWELRAERRLADVKRKWALANIVQLGPCAFPRIEPRPRPAPPAPPAAEATDAADPLRQRLPAAAE